MDLSSDDDCIRCGGSAFLEPDRIRSPNSNAITPFRDIRIVKDDLASRDKGDAENAVLPQHY